MTSRENKGTKELRFSFDFCISAASSVTVTR